MVHMKTAKNVMVYGAAGHTGRFVVDELLRRGLTPVLAGRSAARLATVAETRTDLLRRVVAIDDPTGLREALQGVGVVINCAGPFLDTALPLARAAVENGAHYLDVTAEQPAVLELYVELDAAARAAGVAVIPAMAFYGGLADLLVTAALAGNDHADEIDVAIGLDRWWPTEGTRLTGARNTAPRQVIRGGALSSMPDPAPVRDWTFPGALGEQEVIELPFSEVHTVGRHLRVGELRSHLSTRALADIRDSATPPPKSESADGRSAQQFVVDVVVRQGESTRRLSVTGRDIYAVTAPIIVEGAVRLLNGDSREVGAVAPGSAFGAADLLAALEREVDGLSILRHDCAPAIVSR